METTIEKYDPSKLMEMVRDRIRATYVSLIPEEQWAQMVKKEIDSFFAEKNISYDSRGIISDFKTVVYSELEKKTREEAKKYLESISHTEWNDGKYKAGEFVKQLFIEKSGEMFLSIMGSMVQNAINNAPRY
jgi:hypothetical protein